jgi:hypothetical protein
LEVVRLAAIGKSDREIAMILKLKSSTIETYMAQLRQAFDVYSRTQVCLTAARPGSSDSRTQCLDSRDAGHFQSLLPSRSHETGAIP